MAHTFAQDLWWRDCLVILFDTWERTHMLKQCQIEPLRIKKREKKKEKKREKKEDRKRKGITTSIPIVLYR